MSNDGGAFEIFKSDLFVPYCTLKNGFFTSCRSERWI